MAVFGNTCTCSSKRTPVLNTHTSDAQLDTALGQWGSEIISLCPQMWSQHFQEEFKVPSDIVKYV